MLFQSPELMTAMVEHSFVMSAPSVPVCCIEYHPFTVLLFLTVSTLVVLEK